MLARAPSRLSLGMKADLYRRAAAARTAQRGEPSVTALADEIDRSRRERVGEFLDEGSEEGGAALSPT